MRKAGGGICTWASRHPSLTPCNNCWDLPAGSTRRTSNHLSCKSGRHVRPAYAGNLGRSENPAGTRRGLAVLTCERKRNSSKMARAISKVAPGWWDYTTLDQALLNDAATLSENDLLQLSRPGFQVSFYETLEEFYLAEALEYINAWMQATPDQPAGICGPIGPTEQLP